MNKQCNVVADSMVEEFEAFPKEEQEALWVVLQARCEADRKRAELEEMLAALPDEYAVKILTYARKIVARMPQGTEERLAAFPEAVESVKEFAFKCKAEGKEC